jgi:hypothetical protein
MGAENTFNPQVSIKQSPIEKLSYKLYLKGYLISLKIKNQFLQYIKFRLKSLKIKNQPVLTI